MKKTRSGMRLGTSLAVVALVAFCAGQARAGVAEVQGPPVAVESPPTGQPAVEASAPPIVPMPAARNMRYSLAEKRAAIEGRAKMKAEIAARKAAQQPPAEQSQP